MSDLIGQDAGVGASQQVIRFIHHLKAADYRAGIENGALALKAFSAQDYPDREMSRRSLRAICCASKREWLQFDTLFDRYWNPDGESDTEEISSDEPPEGSQSRGGISGISGSTEVFSDLDNTAQQTAAGAGRQTTLAMADFRFLGDQDAMRRIELVAEELAKRIRKLPSRRRVAGRAKGQLAIGATLRNSIRTAGVPVDPRYLYRKLEERRIVILHDVSHSMTFNNPLLVRFTRGLVRRFRKSEAFVFHTRLYPVTEIFRQPSVQRMRDMLERNNRLWLGGTCIADSLSQFRNEYARKILRGNTILLIISDGFDSNEPQRLAEELGQLGRQCRRIIWLNPMLQREGFDPDKEEVWNVRRNVDHLLPAHSLDALRRCVSVI